MNGIERSFGSECCVDMYENIAYIFATIPNLAVWVLPDHKWRISRRFLGSSIYNTHQNMVK